MPFKIYTYEDPYKLDKADFWSEISALPHFCSARTLVNGLKDVLGDNIKGLICPLDELVQHEEVYMQWTDNISLRVQQYSAFSSAFKQLLEKRRISKPFHMALEQNQNHFLEAIRLFIELARCEASPGGVVDSRWGRGIVVSRASEPYAEDKPYWYWIKFPNGKYAKECETELKFDYSQMNYAPDKQLRAYEFQHPTWFINHLKVSKNLHLVNNATYGFRVLAGCRAFLLPHQISTVARCFETTPVRYMLADEVGLGKTVEACSILSILSSENKDLRVLIVVPGALASQWKNELHYKDQFHEQGVRPRAIYEGSIHGSLWYRDREQDGCCATEGDHLAFGSPDGYGRSASPHIRRFRCGIQAWEASMLFPHRFESWPP